MALDFFAGCLGGCAGIMVGYPLDTIKVHMQTQDYRKPMYKGNWHCFRTLLAKESVAGLYRGMSSPVAGVALVNAIIFGVYGEAQRRIPDSASLSSHFIAGALAGIAQSPICSPIELAKTRMQLQTSAVQFSGPVECLKHTYKLEGFRGLFKGLGITFLREAPSFGVYFLTYEALTRNSDSNPVSTSCMLLAGGMAGTASWVISYPLDVIKSRIQANANRYDGIIDCLKKSINAEGYSCLYRGLSSTILRAFPTNAVTFTVVTWTFRLFAEENVEEIEEKKSKIVVESFRDISEAREPFLEKWNGFLASLHGSMMIHRLNYSSPSLMNKFNDRWMKEGIKCNEQTQGDKFDKNESEKPKTPRDDVQEDCEFSEKKVERSVVKQTTRWLSCENFATSGEGGRDSLQSFDNYLN